MCPVSVIDLRALESDPHAILADLRRTRPVAWVEELGAFVVTRRDLALTVLRDDATFTVDDPRFTTGRVLGASMLSTDGDEHARRRAPFARPFRLAAVRKRHAASVRAEVARLLTAMPPDGPVDLRERLTAPLAAATMVDALALDAPVSEVLAIYETIAAAVSGLAMGAQPPSAAADAMTRLARLVARPAELADTAVLLFGGIETTDGMIANALLHVLAAPGVALAVLDDEALLANAVEESLRLEPAAATIDRYTTCRVLLGGVRIPRRSLVTVSVAAANRDPETFPDPDRFDPHRANARLHLAFAQGPHVCLGMHLARLEAHVALGETLRRFPHLRLDPDLPSVPRGLVFRKPSSLSVLLRAPAGS